MEAVGGERESSNGNGNGTFGAFSWRKDELEALSLSASSRGGGLVLVAADVIYDEGLTDAFFHVLRLLMPVPVPPAVSAGRNSGGKLAGDGSDDDVTSASKEVKCDSLADQTPSAQSASSENSVGFEATASGQKSTGDERTFSSAERGLHAVMYLALEKRFNFSMAELSVAATGYGALLRNVLDTTQADSGVDRSAQQTDAEKDFEGRRLPLSFQQCFHYQRNDAMELWEIRRRRRR